MNRFNSISRTSSAVRRFIFRFSESYDCICASRTLSRGVRVVTNVGRRCDGRFLRCWTGDHEADGEIGPDLPTLGSTAGLKARRDAGYQSPRHKPQNHCAGKAGSIQSNLLLAHEASSARSSLRLVFSKGRNFQMPRTFFVARALRACKSWLVSSWDAGAEPAPCDGRLSVRMSLPVSMVATAQRLLRRGNILRTFSVSRSSLLLTPLFSHTPQ
jgi:hypothetical protein